MSAGYVIWYNSKAVVDLFFRSFSILQNGKQWNLATSFSQAVEVALREIAFAHLLRLPFVISVKRLGFVYAFSRRGWGY